MVFGEGLKISKIFKNHPSSCCSSLIDELQRRSIAGAGGAEVGRVRGDLAVALRGLRLEGREGGLALVQEGLVEGSFRDSAASRDTAGATTEGVEGLLGGGRHSAYTYLIQTGGVLHSRYETQL